MGAESGQDLVEYALVLPLFLLLIFSIVEFGFLFFQYTMVVNAAREGARAGVVMDTADCPRSCLEGKVVAAARRMMTSVDPALLDIDPDWETAGGRPVVIVNVRYDTSLMTRVLLEWIGGIGSITLETTATMQREY
jgi:hypothetical protein